MPKTHYTLEAVWQKAGARAHAPQTRNEVGGGHGQEPTRSVPGAHGSGVGQGRERRTMDKIIAQGGFGYGRSPRGACWEFAGSDLRPEGLTIDVGAVGRAPKQALTYQRLRYMRGFETPITKSMLAPLTVSRNTYEQINAGAIGRAPNDA